jgi:hypothetical protein
VPVKPAAPKADSEDFEQEEKFRKAVESMTQAETMKTLSAVIARIDREWTGKPHDALLAHAAIRINQIAQALLDDPNASLNDLSGRGDYFFKCRWLNDEQRQHWNEEFSRRMLNLGKPPIEARSEPVDEGPDFPEDSV